jgi:hypothetical protein
MAGLAENRRAAALVGLSVLARLPLALFSISLLIYAHQLTSSFALAGLSASATGASLGTAAAGALTQSLGTQAGFALAAIAGATAVLTALARGVTLNTQLVNEQPSAAA